MTGLASTAVATFLIEALCRYIGGDFLGIAFLGHVGDSAGSMAGVAAVILVMASMGANPVSAVAGGMAMSGFGILLEFISGFIAFYVSRLIDSKLPSGINTITSAIAVSILCRAIATIVASSVDLIIGEIGESIMVATEQSPILMGFVLGGMMKIICTSPLSSMALTAMLGLTGLPMGIASISCFAGSWTNGILFNKLGLGNKGNTLAVMLEPLTQADTISKNPLPIYASDFIGGGLAGIVAALLGIVNNAPRTASPIPEMLAPFAFNNTTNVLIALGLSAICGILAGLLRSIIFKKLGFAKNISY